MDNGEWISSVVVENDDDDEFSSINNKLKARRIKYNMTHIIL